MPRKFEIYVVRFSDETYEKQIDKLLITTDLKYDEAVDTLERLMKDAGFKHLEQRLRHLRNKGKEKTLVY